MNPVYDSGEVAIVRSGMRAQWVVIFDPCDVVFQAQVAVVPVGDTYLGISYDTVSIGSYLDIRTGQTVILSETADYTVPIRDFKDDMRVAATPTANSLPVNESAYPLTDGLYITVLNTYKPLQKVRQGSLVDGRLAYQGLTGTVNNLPSVSIKRSTGTGQFSLSPVIQRFYGETVSSVSWEIPGATYNTGSASTQNIVVTMPADSHTWGRFTYTLSSGVSHWMAFRLIVINPRSTTLATQAIERGTITRTWQGHHASITARSGVTVSQVMNGSAAVIASFRSWRGGTLDDNPVAFVGYLKKESSSTEGINDRSVSFELTGLWERAASLPFNPIAIRDTATPDSWDDINHPTTQRVVAHILSRYSTILNLCSLNLDDTETTWLTEDMNIAPTSLGDAIEFVGSEIYAPILQAPSGELFLRRDLRIEENQATRDAAPTVWTLSNRDLLRLNLDARHDQQTGRVIGGFRGYNTARTPSKGGKAVAPLVTLGTSPETQTRPNQLLRANQTESALLIEAAARIGNILAYENPPYEFGADVRNLGWLNTAADEWIEMDLVPSDTTRGRAVAGRALIASVSLSYDNREARESVQLEVFAETQGGGAIVVAMLTPNASQLTGVVTPPLAAYGGNYPTPSTINVPDVNTRRPFNRQDMGGMAPPMPADQAYEEGLNNPQGDARAFAISFAEDTPVGAGFTSVNGEDYTITLSGMARVQDETFFELTPFEPAGRPPGSYTQIGPNLYRFTSSALVATFHRVCFFDSLNQNIKITSYSASTTLSGPNWWYDVGARPDLDYEIDYTVLASPVINNCYSGFLLRHTSAFTVDIGIEACGGTPTPTKYADAFYEFELNDEGEPINATYLGTSRGFLVNGAPIASPPLFNPAHVYTVMWEGDGNIPEVVFEDTNHTDNENLLLQVTIEGPNAGT